MKRAKALPPPPDHRHTRYVAHRLNEEAQHQQENEQRRQSELKERAVTLMEQTPELQALPLVAAFLFINISA
jgi:LmbE family N-acetylglucosaminyl deacetylase